ncbi:MAG: DUF922 domain-containing protein [Flavihumibacter sp.]
MPFFLLAFLHLLYTAAPAARAPIDWRERRVLTWNDFKGAPVESAPNAALTSTSILLSYKYGSSGFSYHLQCVFYPDKSWTKVSSGRILAHEQGHFDITQLFTRKMHQALAAYQPRDGKVEEDVGNIHQNIAAQQTTFQQQYDTETNFSRNYEAQAKWLEKIATALEETKDWAGYP